MLGAFHVRYLAVFYENPFFTDIANIHTVKTAIISTNKFFQTFIISIDIFTDIFFIN